MTQTGDHGPMPPPKYAPGTAPTQNPAYAIALSIHVF